MPKHSWVNIVLTSLIVSLLSACGGSSSSNTTAPSASNSSNNPPSSGSNPPNIVSNLALLVGSFGDSNSIKVTGAAARFNNPTGIAVDNNGNIYVADYRNNAIRKITPSGVVTTLAGAGGDFSGQNVDANGIKAQFNNPTDVAVDNNGNVYVADTNDNTIRKITPAGTVTTLAGAAYMAGSANGINAAARFNNPTGIAVDNNGNVYVADSGNQVIRKISQTGLVTTLAGQIGVPGSTDGTGTAAQFSNPSSVAVDKNGMVYVADVMNSTIRKISPLGVVTTLAGTPNVFGNVDGTGATAQFDYPRGVAVDSAGNVLVADNGVIRKITPTGVVSTLAGAFGVSGSADGNGTAARFFSPTSVTVDSSGNTFVVDSFDETIRKITPSGITSILAGTSGVRGSADGTGTAAQFYYPTSVVVDSSGNVFVADSGNNTIRKITSSGVVTTLAGTAGTQGDFDATGAAAQFYNPRGLALDKNGNLYVADTSNKSIRKITPTGVVTTLAGMDNYNGMTGSADGFGSAAQFNQPTGLTVDNNGNVFVADSKNSTIRKITPTGMVTTFAGTAGVRGSVDATGAMAQFYYPTNLTMDSNGNIFVADSGNNTIRKITPSGIVTTLVNSSNTLGLELSSLTNALFQPAGIAMTIDGKLIITSNNAVLTLSF